ncbi:MAG: HAD family phosphatase [Planctomycetes bacterium]|nr:HAD family phosphatase [Planctomycetota bacterium]
MTKIYGLIFDVDGVIADTEAINARASIEMFDELFGLKGVVRKDFEAGLGRGAEAYIRTAAEIHGLELTGDQVDEAATVRQEKILTIIKNEPLQPLDGVLELMAAALQRQDFRLAIATSGTREKSEIILKSVRVPYDKMAYITGSEIANKKPDPELFLTAAAKAGVSAADCLVIEDAPDGIAAAKSAGCKCIAVTNSTTAERLTQADLIIESLTQIDIDKIAAMIDG